MVLEFPELLFVEGSISVSVVLAENQLDVFLENIIYLFRVHFF